MLTDGLDSSDWVGAANDRGYLNGHNNPLNTDGQVDMLDIPGKGRCSVYIARYEKTFFLHFHSKSAFFH